MLKTRAGKIRGTQIACHEDGAFTIEEFCELYGVGRTAFYEEINSGRLIAKKRGSRTLIPRSNARAWFELLPAMVGQTSCSQTAAHPSNALGGKK